MDQLSGIEGLRGAVEKEGRRSMNLFEVVWHFARVERDPWLSPLPLWTRGWTAPTSTMISRPPRTHLHSPPTPTRKCDFGRDVGCDRLVLAKDASVSFTPLCMCVMTSLNVSIEHSSVYALQVHSPPLWQSSPQSTSPTTYFYLT